MTAVEFLESQYKFNGQLFKSDFEQAKEMEKQQIEMAFFKGKTFGMNLPDGLTGEEYYNETFKSE